MRWYRFLPFVLTAVAVALLAGALRGPAIRPASASSEVGTSPLVGLETTTPDPEAASAIDQALASLADPARTWLQTAVWLRAQAGPLAYEGEGIYLRAPGGRYRMEVRTRGIRVGGKGTEGTMLDVSDGQDRWQATRLGGGPFKDVKQMRVDPDTPPLPGQLVSGPEPLLRSLHSHVSWVKNQPQGPDIIVLGWWHDALRRALSPDGRPWPATLPRGCRLWLRGPERWLARLEWWGPTTDGGTDKLLIEMEFRDPVRDRPIPESECARLFTFQPPLLSTPPTK